MLAGARKNGYLHPNLTRTGYIKYFTNYFKDVLTYRISPPKAVPATKTRCQSINHTEPDGLIATTGPKPRKKPGSNITINTK